MKKILTTLLALGLALTAFAQNGSELEIGSTGNYFLGREVDHVSYKRPVRPGIFMEYRVNAGHLDFGAQLSSTFGKGKIVGNGYMDNGWFLQVAPLAVADFNILPERGFNPFIGVGVGPGFGYESNKITKNDKWATALVLAPRAGVKLFERLNLSVQYNWYMKKGEKFSNVAIGLGWIIPTSR